jgi:hypothetical protein
MKAMMGAGLLALAGLLAGCISPQSYVDPQYRLASYDAIQRVAQPVPVKVDVHFQRNGKPLPAADNELRGHVERTLRATGVFTPAADAAGTISITGNNIADLAEARSKGFATGLTFGAAGSMVDDNYEFTCAYQDGAGHDRNASFKHAIHTAIGKTEAPANLTPTTPADAFGHVVEDVVLNFVKQLQDAGLVPKQ